MNIHATLYRWEEIVLLGLACCYAKSPPLLAEFKTALVKHTYHLGELMGSLSPLYRPRKKISGYFFQRLEVKPFLSWKVPQGPPLSFLLSGLLNTATTKYMAIIPFSLEKHFQHQLRNLNTSESSCCWLTFAPETTH